MQTAYTYFFYRQLFITDPSEFDVPRYIEPPGNCGIMSIVTGINPSARQLLMNFGMGVKDGRRKKRSKETGGGN